MCTVASTSRGVMNDSTLDLAPDSDYIIPIPITTPSRPDPFKSDSSAGLEGKFILLIGATSVKKAELYKFIS